MLSGLPVNVVDALGSEEGAELRLDDELDAPDDVDVAVAEPALSLLDEALLLDELALEPLELELDDDPDDPEEVLTTPPATAALPSIVVAQPTTPTSARASAAPLSATRRRPSAVPPVLDVPVTLFPLPADQRVAPAVVPHDPRFTQAPTPPGCC